MFINYGYGDTTKFLDANDSNMTDTNLSFGFAKSTTVQELDYLHVDGTIVYKDVNYITFLTDAVGGIQSKILLPVTCGTLPPTGNGSDGSSFEQKCNKV